MARGNIPHVCETGASRYENRITHIFVTDLCGICGDVCGYREVPIPQDQQG